MIKAINFLFTVIDSICHLSVVVEVIELSFVTGTCNCIGYDALFKLYVYLLGFRVLPEAMPRLREKKTILKGSQKVVQTVL